MKPIGLTNSSTLGYSLSRIGDCLAHRITQSYLSWCFCPTLLGRPSTNAVVPAAKGIAAMAWHTASGAVESPVGFPFSVAGQQALLRRPVAAANTLPLPPSPWFPPLPP